MFGLFYITLLWNIFKMLDVAKPFEMKLISSLENDKEKYFCVNKYKDLFYRFANRNCFSMSMRKKRSDYVTLGIWIWFQR